MKDYYVYVMSNHLRSTFYIGVTNNLRRRIAEHKMNTGSKFISKYKLYDLVYFEYFNDITYAIAREKQLKNWHRNWKLNLIRKMNPDLEDLSKLLD
jgi:putative endonuclease